jgi:arylsulfatase A-like enzyme
MASLWTASYPNRTGILRFDHALPDTATLPAEILLDAGFVTAGIWRNGWVAPTFGFEQGFEVYHRPEIGAPIDAVRRESDNPDAKLAGSDFDLADGTVEFLRAYRDKRFFLYLHLMDVHQYRSDEESAIFGTSYSDLCDSSVLWSNKPRGAGALWTARRHPLRDRFGPRRGLPGARQRRPRKGPPPPIVSRTTDTRHSDKLGGRGPFRDNVRRYDKWIHGGAMWPYPGGFQMLRK